MRQRAMDEVASEKTVDVGKIAIWSADEARIGQKNKITACGASAYFS